MWATTMIATPKVLGKYKPLFRSVTIKVSPHTVILPPELPRDLPVSEIDVIDIHRLVVRNYILEAQGYVNQSVQGTGLIVGAAMMGMANRAKVAEEVGWAVDVETGGRSYTLAFGLNQVTANGLMEDISRAIKM